MHVRAAISVLALSHTVVLANHSYQPHRLDRKAEHNCGSALQSVSAPAKVHSMTIANQADLLS